VAADASCCWTAGGRAAGVLGFVGGGFEARKGDAAGFVVVQVHFDANGVAALELAAVGRHSRDGGLAVAAASTRAVARGRLGLGAVVRGCC
jgi:hypothetical protein